MHEEEWAPAPVAAGRKRLVYLATLLALTAEAMAANPLLVDARRATKVLLAESVQAAHRAQGVALPEWVCVEEKHEDGAPHFHMALRADKQHRWVGVRNDPQLELSMCADFRGPQNTPLATDTCASGVGGYRV